MRDEHTEETRQEIEALQQRIVDLEALVIENKQATSSLEIGRDELEKRVQLYIAEVAETNEALQREIEERNRTDTEFGQLSRQLLTLQAAGAAITSSFDLQHVLNTVTREMAHLLGIENCVISDWNEAENTFVAIAEYSPVGSGISESIGEIYSLQDYPLTERVLVEKHTQQITVNQPDADPSEIACMKRDELKMLVMLPMIFKDRVVGLVEMSDTKAETIFTDQEIALAQLLANQATGAIENARLHEQAQQEIAERKRAEAAALVSRDILQRFIHQLPIGVQIFDLNGLCTDVNSAMMNMFGIARREDAVGRFNLFDDPLGKDSGTPLAAQKALAGNVVHLPEVDYDFKYADPRYKRRYSQRTLSITYFPVRGHDNEIIQIVALNEDITKRKEAERNLASERERLAVTLQSITDGVVAVNGTGHIILTNPVAETYLKLLVDAEVNDRLIHPGDESFAELFLLLSNKKTTYELTVQGSPNQIFEIALQPIRSSLYVNGGQVLVIRDVTEAHQARDRSQQQERLAAVGQLAAGIAHDFNNILTSVIGFAELLRLDPNLSSSAKNDLHRIVQQGQRGAHLIRQILDFSRQTIAAKQAMDLAPFLRETIKLLERTIPEDIRVTSKTEAGEYLLNADSAQLQQMLTNLAVNAWDVMPDGGRLHFDLKHLNLAANEPAPHPGVKAGSWIILAISDTGLGMTPEVQARAFEPFFTTKDVNKGTGLGLAQVDGIVKQHQGQIYVEGQVGQGTTFTIYLPALASVNADQFATMPSGIPIGDKETILLVEDSPSVLSITKKLLEHLNYRILTATNGRLALDVYDRYQSDIALVLTDITMPEMGGLALAHALHQRDPEIKVIAMTGYPLKTENKELLTQGIVDWLQKPLQIKQLARVVGLALQFGPGQRSQTRSGQ